MTSLQRYRLQQGLALFLALKGAIHLAWRASTGNLSLTSDTFLDVAFVLVFGMLAYRLWRKGFDEYVQTELDTSKPGNFIALVLVVIVAWVIEGMVFSK